MILSGATHTYTFPTPTNARRRRRHHPIRARQPEFPVNIRPPLRPHAPIPRIHADMSAIREIPRPVIERRPDSDDLAVLRHTHTHPAVIIAPLADHDIRPTRNPQTVGGKIVNADLSSVDNTAQIVVGCAHRDGSTIRGETYAHAASVAGDDFV